MKIKNDVVILNQKERELSNKLNLAYCANCGEKTQIAWGFCNLDFKGDKILCGFAYCSETCMKEHKKRMRNLQEKLVLNLPKKEDIPCGCTCHKKLGLGK